MTPEDLARATQRLRITPLDHGAWLEVAALLAALGHGDDAETAFATIGEGARIGGQVALAVACARHLAEVGSLRGPELIDQIVETYAEIKRPPTQSSPPTSARARPSPSPPSSPSGLASPRSSPSIEIPGDQPTVPPGATPLEDARAVVDKIGGWMTARKIATSPLAPLLSALSKSGARSLIGVMTARAVAAGTVIIEVGEPASALYWIAHGTVSVARPDGTQLGELHSGAFFGEIALVGGTKRTARVTARDDCWLLEIPARAVENAAQKQPRLAEVLAIHARNRLLANLMKSSELFKSLAIGDRDALLEKFTTEMVAAGTAIIREGTGNDSLWVVVSGNCVVKSAGSQIAELGPGAAVGEISLISGAKAVADVEAIESAVLLRLSKTDFDAVAAKHPALKKVVESLASARTSVNLTLFQDASDLIV